MPVRITAKEVVAPLSHHQPAVMSRVAFSNLDYFYHSKLHVSVYFCYAKPEAGSGYDHQAMVDVLRESLAQTLSSYVIFAGEVVTNSAGGPEVLLSGRGADFSRASVDLELEDVDLFRPDISVRGQLVPHLQQGVLAVQVTELRCGGLVLGLTFAHRVADAYSANMFMVSWSENALHKQPHTYVPNINRTLIHPAHPVSINHHNSAASTLERWYTPVPRDDLPRLIEDLYHHHPNPDEHFTSRTFYVEAQTIKGLQEKACLKINGCKKGFRTKYEAFTAALWQLLAKSTTNGSSSVKISIAIDGRTQMNNKSTQNAVFMQGYFGNVMSFPFTSATAAALRSMSLSDAADLVHRCKVETATPDHFWNVINWVEDGLPEMIPGARIYMEEPDDGAAFMVSSGQRFPVKEVVFGWGKAVFGSYYFPWMGRAGYVMPMPSAVRDGDWVVFMNLRKKHMEVVEKDGGHVFRPLDSSYLKFGEG